jgi:hypothetical protein
MQHAPDGLAKYVRSISAVFRLFDFSFDVVTSFAVGVRGTLMVYPVRVQQI